MLGYRIQDLPEVWAKRESEAIGGLTNEGCWYAIIVHKHKLIRNGPNDK